MNKFKRIVIGLTVVTSLISSGCQNKLSKEMSVWNYYTEGEKAILLASYDMALSYYEDALESVLKAPDPLHPDITAGMIYFNMGYCYDQMGNSEEALTSYLQAYADESSKSLACSALGSLYFQLEKYELSKDYFEEAIVLDAKAYEAYVNLSALYSLGKDRKMALSLLSQAIEINNQKPDAYLNRAYLFACLGDETLMKKDIETLKAMKFSSIDVYIKIFNDTLKEVQR